MVMKSLTLGTAPRDSFLPSSGQTFFIGMRNFAMILLTTRSRTSATTIMITLMRIMAPMTSGESTDPASLFSQLMNEGPVKKELCTPIMVSAMYVPPVSDRDLAKQSMNPVARPALNIGSVMVLTAVHLDAPRVMAAVS